MPKGRIELVDDAVCLPVEQRLQRRWALVVDKANDDRPVASRGPRKCCRSRMFDQHENNIDVLRHFIGDRPSRAHVTTDTAQLPDQGVRHRRRADAEPEIRAERRSSST